MKNNFETKKSEALSELMNAMQSEDGADVISAWQKFSDVYAEAIKNEVSEGRAEQTALIARGARTLTPAEHKFYERFIEVCKSGNPKQAYADLLTIDGGMPETIIEDVFKDLVDAHPLLNAINFTDVKYLSRWVLNANEAQSAVWGTVTDEIKQEVKSGFKEVNLTLAKLTAWTSIPNAMLDLGPAYLDSYIRTILTEALQTALESAIISGTGNGEPIGLDRDLSSQTNGEYAEKKAVKVTEITPATYGELVAQLATSENGHARTINKVAFICNPSDYLTKVMPATTVMNSMGQYVSDRFPIATDVIQSACLESGKAILCLPEDYFLGIGAKKGVIESTDQYEFIEDATTYKIVLHGDGRPYDNTVSTVLDISELETADTVLATTING